MRTRFLVPCLLALLVVAAVADEFVDEFNGNELDPASYTIIKPAGFNVEVTGGELVLSKLEGTTSGFNHVSSAFTVKGDFEASVVAERTLVSSGSVMGLISHHISAAGFTDIYFAGSNMYSNIIVGGINVPKFLAESAQTVTFRIRRTGQEIFHEYDAGSGFVAMNSASGSQLTGPVQIGVFIGEEGGQSARTEVAYDDFSVTGDVFTPPCGNGVLEEGEACDDDSPAWANGDFCDATCAILACGDTDNSGSITVVDALHALRTSVATRTCDACVCNVDSSGGEVPTTVADALRLLRKSVGQEVELNCPACV